LPSLNGSSGEGRGLDLREKEVEWRGDSKDILLRQERARGREKESIR
jgi:hypothetical protein